MDLKAGGDGEEGRGSRFLSALDQKILKEYFADPPPRTVVVVVRAGRYRRDDAVVRFFSSLPKAVVSVTEMKRLTEYALMRRADEQARALGKTADRRGQAAPVRPPRPGPSPDDERGRPSWPSSSATRRGSRRTTSTGPRPASAASRPTSLDDALAAADFAKGAAILNDLFAEGERPELIVGRLAGFFRNVLAAQTWLREKSRTKDEIFQALLPLDPEGSGASTTDKSRDFFGVVEGLSLGRAQRPPGQAPQGRQAAQDDGAPGARGRSWRSFLERVLPGQDRKGRLFRRSGAELRRPAGSAAICSGCPCSS
ncbi:MAG: hypothetical protein MZV64_49500 [Ignavibacteriales bacterium]|nr:hypothetical protein [Ignavibacteriales bacterium]